MEDANEMNKGVQILLERMNSNPDEFVPDVIGRYPPKWMDIIASIQVRVEGKKDSLQFLNDTEIHALWNKLQKLQGDVFTKRIMNTLLRGDPYLSSVKEITGRTIQELSSLALQVTSGSTKNKKQ